MTEGDTKKGPTINIIIKLFKIIKTRKIRKIIITNMVTIGNSNRMAERLFDLKTWMEP